MLVMTGRLARVSSGPAASLEPGESLLAIEPAIA
jgi:hypothetical protein